jgi:hypothetical protein
MGYYVNTEDINVIVPRDLLEDAYKAVLTLNDRDDLKRGGSFGAERKYWFSWMPEDLKTLPDLKAVFTQLGFEDCDYNEQGDLVLGHYNNKSGQEDIFLYVIAPFVQENSYAIWKGEDDAHWKHEFRDGKMFTYNGEVEVKWDETPYDTLNATIELQRQMDQLRLEFAARSEKEADNA